MKTKIWKFVNCLKVNLPRKVDDQHIKNVKIWPCFQLQIPIGNVPLQRNPLRHCSITKTQTILDYVILRWRNKKYTCNKLPHRSVYRLQSQESKGVALKPERLICQDNASVLGGGALLAKFTLTLVTFRAGKLRKRFFRNDTLNSRTPKCEERVLTNEDWQGFQR